MLKKALRTAQNYFPGGRDGREAVSRRIQRRLARPHESDFLALRHFPPKRVLLDVGANYGQSIDSMLLMQPTATVIAYEPNSSLANKVAQVFHGDRRVSVRPFGLSDMSGACDLFVPYYRGFAYPGLASILSEEAARSLLSSETLYFFCSEKVSVERVQCQFETLDSQNLSPYLVKIDVQGAEYKVLHGGHATLARHQPILLVENAGGDPKIATLLASLGYSEYEYVYGNFIKRRSEGDNSFFMTTIRRDELANSKPNLFL